MDNYYKNIIFGIIVLLVFQITACGRVGNEIFPTEVSESQNFLPTNAEPALSDKPLEQNTQSTIEVTPLPIILSSNTFRYGFGIASGDSFEKIADSGFSWVRIMQQLNWANIESQKGVYDWDEELDKLIKEAANNRLKVILTISHSPTWARKYPDRACGPIKEEAFTDFAEFLQLVINKYSADPYYVNHFMIGNEPDASISDTTNGNNGNSQFGCWAEETYPNDPFYGGEYYGKMLKAVYPIMKQTNPSIEVILGGLLLACDPRIPEDGNSSDGFCPISVRDKWNFFEGIVKEAGDSFDIVAFHSYTYHVEGKNPVYEERSSRSYWAANGGVIDGKINYLREIMNDYGAQKPIIITEAALLTNSPSTPVFEDAKADYLTWVFAKAWSQGISTTIWYSLEGWKFSGLVNIDNEPLAAYHAFQTMTKLLSDFKFIDYEETSSYSKFIFKSDDVTIWLLVPIGEEYEIWYGIEKPKGFLSAIDKFGTEIIPTELIYFNHPIYVLIRD